MRLETFLQLQSDQSLTDEQFAKAVLNSPLTTAKHKLLRNVMTNSWRDDRIDDALQEAALSMLDYLTSDRGRSFRGQTDDALASWLYCRLREHATWALLKQRRGDERRRHHEQAAARSPAENVAWPEQFTRVLGQVLAFIGNLPEPRRTVGLDWHRGVAIGKTCRKCQLSQRRVYELRKHVLEQAREKIREIL